MGRPKKPKFPVELDALLRVALRPKRTEDRMKIFREWRRTELRAELKREPTDQEVAAEIQLIRDRKFHTANQIFHFSESIKDFVPGFEKENRRKKAQIAAKAKWSKKSEKSS
jgi:DNA-directed RNA polymerase specialized sigma subunit